MSQHRMGTGLEVVEDFRVLDESDDWIVVEKPAPLIVHPANRGSEPTLLGGVEQLLAYEMSLGKSPAVITRLDRETSGIVLLAKHRAAARELGMSFERREPRKEYLAIVRGWPAAGSWVCEAPIVRAGEIGDSRIWVRQIVHASGRECRTDFQVERRFTRNGQEFTLLRCFPRTGRMHQIRVHLAHSGHPILGDKIYGGDGSEYLEWMEQGMSPPLLARLGLARHALHAARLRLEMHGHAQSWECPLAADMRDFVEGREISPASKVVFWRR